MTSRAPSPASPATLPEDPRILVVGAGGIGGVVAGLIAAGGRDVAVLSTNERITQALRADGFVVRGHADAHAPARRVVPALDSADRFDLVLLATQPPQVEDAARSIAAHLSDAGRVVCFQNGLCEDRVAALVGAERVVGAVVAWGASMVAPGVYERTSEGGFTVGRLRAPPDEAIERIGRILSAVGPVALTDNLLGARFSKLAINCAVSTLGTIGGGRVGPLLRRRVTRRLALEIMTEAVHVARKEGVQLEKVGGTIDLDWVALSEAEWRTQSSPSLVAKHALLLGVGMKYRRLRSSMLAAIERGRVPAVDFLNGEVVDRAERHGIDAAVNRAARDTVWRIARGTQRPGVAAIRGLFDSTRRRAMASPSCEV